MGKQTTTLCTSWNSLEEILKTNIKKGNKRLLKHRKNAFINKSLLSFSGMKGYVYLFTQLFFFNIFVKQFKSVIWRFENILTLGYCFSKSAMFSFIMPLKSFSGLSHKNISWTSPLILLIYLKHFSGHTNQTTWQWILISNKFFQLHWFILWIKNLYSQMISSSLFLSVCLLYAYYMLSSNLLIWSKNCSF